jgi:IS605 OrfB family transposase
MPLVNRILSIRISGKQRKEKILNLLYSLAHFRNLLVIFNQTYNKTYGNLILNESYLYALLSGTSYTPRGEYKDKKLKEFNHIIENIQKEEKLNYFLNELKQQKQKIKNNHIIQTLIKQLLKDYKSYFKSLKEYKRQPNKFKGKPKPPKAKKLNNLPSFTAQLNTNTFKKIDRTHLLITLTFGKKKQYLKVKLPENFDYEMKSVRIKFIANDVYVDVVYKKEIKLENVEKKYKAGIDIGLNNLLTIFSTNEKIRTLIVNGKEIKSINQWYNKEKAKLQSQIDLLQNQISKLRRENQNTEYLEKEKTKLQIKQKQLSAYRNRWITDIFHKITRKLADFLNETGHKEVYIGRGATESKNRIKIGKKNNQNFVYIPFRKLISQLKYKLEEYGIKLIEVSEEYTSKTSSFVEIREVLKLSKEYKEKKNDKLKEKIEELLQGKRIKRGLFKCYITGKVFNADAIGSYNILRKEAKPLIDEDTLIDKLSRPIKIKIKQLEKVTCESLKEITGRKTRWAYCKVGIDFL